MSRDPYKRRAGAYAAIVDRLNRRLHEVVFGAHAVTAGDRVLDVGCGTGAQLACYVDAGCDASGVDLSPAMLAIARERLGEHAHLQLADATELPHDDAAFDVVIASMFLHELSPDVRREVVAEMARVLAEEGVVVVVDFGVGDLNLRGRATRLLSRAFELAAGRAHFREYRRFLATGGIESLLEDSALRIVSARRLAGGDLTLVIAEAR